MPRKPVLLKILVFFALAYGLAITALYFDSYSEPDFVAEVGIVYGNTVEPDGKPSARLQARLMAALSLYQQQRIKKILVSGGIGKEGFDEARVMKEFLIAHGIPSADIQSDNHGNNSHLTALNAAALLGKETSVVAISQRYHLSRAKLSLRNAGFTQVYGFAAGFSEARDGYSWLREVPAWLKYWVQG